MEIQTTMWVCEKCGLDTGHFDAYRLHALEHKNFDADGNEIEEEADV